MTDGYPQSRIDKLIEFMEKPCICGLPRKQHVIDKYTYYPVTRSHYKKLDNGCEAFEEGEA